MSMWNVIRKLKRMSKTMRRSKTVPIRMKKKISNQEDNIAKVKVLSKTLAFIYAG